MPNSKKTATGDHTTGVFKQVSPTQEELKSLLDSISRHQSTVTMAAANPVTYASSGQFAVTPPGADVTYRYLNLDGDEIELERNARYEIVRTVMVPIHRRGSSKERVTWDMEIHCYIVPEGGMIEEHP